MRIGIDARLYGAKHGGIGRYAAELIKNLEQQDRKNDYFIFLARDNFDDYIPRNPNFKKISADFKVYGVFEQLLYPFLLYRHNLDLMHFTHFNAPILYGKKFIVTIHDLIISHYPSSRATTLNPWLYKIKLAAYDFLISRVARKAKKIIAVSEFTKNDIVRLLKAAPEKISVIYEGVDLPCVIMDEGNSNEYRVVKKKSTSDVTKSITQGEPAGGATGSAEVFDELGIKGDYLMYVGSAYPHKNLEKLIEAFGLLAKDFSNLQLVLVGKNNFFYERLKVFAAAHLPPETRERVIFAGYRSDEEIARLYRQAKVYVFPSLLEGFGLPPLEAQNFGLPVVSSDRSCLPEILGDSALYFDPENILDMAEKIKTALNDENLRQKLIIAGEANIKKYSWGKMAKEIREMYISF